MGQGQQPLTHCTCHEGGHPSLPSLCPRSLPGLPYGCLCPRCPLCPLGPPASRCLPGPYLMGAVSLGEPGALLGGGGSTAHSRPEPFRQPLPALPGEGVPVQADRLAPAGSWCPVSPRP